MLLMKLCVNAIPAGLYTALCVTGLAMLVNLHPASGHLWPSALPAILLTCALIYVPLVAVVLPLLLLTVRFFAVRRLSMTWVHPKSMVWFSIAAMGLLTAACHLNLRYYDDLIPPAAREGLKLTAMLLAICWGAASICAGLAQAPHRARRWRSVAVCLLAAPAVALFAAGGAAAPPDGSRPALTGQAAAAEQGLPDGRVRLLVVEIESATMDQVLPLVASGRLPSFSRLLKEGASARLNTIRFGPDGADRAALLSGMPAWMQDLSPRQTIRLRGFAMTDLQLAPRGVLFVPLAARHVETGSAQRRPPTLDGLCRALGMQARWIEPEAPADAGEARDPGLERALRRILESPPGSDDAVARSLEGIVARGLQVDFLARAQALAALGEEGSRRADFVGVSLPGLAEVNRYFLRYQSPEEFGDVPLEEASAYGPAPGRYYEMLDEILAELAGAAGEQAHVIVVSAHGVQPVTLPERFGGQLAWGASPAEGLVTPSGSWWQGPDGLLLIHGPGMLAGSRLEDADLQDLVPTTLYLLGLPLGRDMRGRLLRKAFDPGHLEAHQVLFIPAYPPDPLPLRPDR